MAQPQSLPRVIHLTERWFPGRVSIEVLSDPESPSETFFVLNVEAHGNAMGLFERQCQWHERVAALVSAEAGSYRLSIDPQP